MFNDRGVARNAPIIICEQDRGDPCGRLEKCRNGNNPLQILKGWFCEAKSG